MSRLIQYTLCVLFLITVGLAASVEDSVVFKVAFGIGKKQQVSIPTEATHNQPPWDPMQQEEPPYPVGKAISVARKWLNDALKKDAFDRLRPATSCEYKIVEIRIETVEDDRWIYRVVFEEQPIGTGWMGGEMSKIDVLVDMDGVLWIPE